MISTEHDAFTTGEEQFVSEIAYIMTALHEEGYTN